MVDTTPERPFADYKKASIKKIIENRKTKAFDTWFAQNEPPYPKRLFS